MSKNVFIDFKELKQHVTIEQILDHYSLLPKLTRKNDQLLGTCPVCQSRSKDVFKAHTTKNVWKCFAGKGCTGGNILDLVMQIEGIKEVREAGLLIVEWFGLPDAEATPQIVTPSEVRNSDSEIEELTENKPLGFELKKLETDHTEIKKLGLKAETIQRFALGFCSKGMLAGRVVIPIHNLQDELLAYAGMPSKTDRNFKLPAIDKFNPKLELYNTHNVFQVTQRKNSDLIIVTEFPEVWKLYEIGLTNVVSLMPNTPLTLQQLNLLLEHLAEWQQITLICDPADHIGDTLVALTSNFYVRYGQFSYASLYQDILERGNT